MNVKSERWAEAQRYGSMFLNKLDIFKAIQTTFIVSHQRPHHCQPLGPPPSHHFSHVIHLAPT